MKKRIEIKPLGECPEYAPILAHWSYRQWYINRTIGFDLVLAAYRQRVKENVMPVSYVALSNSFPVGMVTLKENDLWARKDINPWLASLYVMPDFRNNGIGEMLVDRVVEASRCIGMPKIYLFLGELEGGVLEQYYGKRGWKFCENAVDNDGKDTKIFSYTLKDDRIK